MDSSNEALVLDQPCEYCKVLELDDTQHGGIVKEAECGKRFVQFTKPAYQRMGMEYQLKLGYHRGDTLPGLPNIAATAQTCAFCHMLRSDLRFSYQNLQLPRVKGINGNEDENHAIRGAKITITDVNYLFDSGWSLAKQWDDDNDGPRHLHHSGGCNDWLDLLIVSIVMDWGYEKENYFLQYRIYADAYDPCRPWLRIRRKPISNDFTSARSLRRLHELIDNALSDASDSVQSKNLPTRLIDVRANNSTNLRLVVSKHDQDCGGETDPVKRRYLALSYCWGSEEESEKQLKTTASSLIKHLSQIDINEMPQTVADAVHACRALGVRYLWVDALCIIQGDDDDWARESLQVAKVYGSSFLTLCDLQGSSCLSGFLKTKWSRPTLQVNFRSKLDASISGTIHLRMQGPAVLIKKLSNSSRAASTGLEQPDLKCSLWNTRGWTFQEALLSSRVVFFDEEMFSYAWADQHIFADGSRYPEGSFLSRSKLKPYNPMGGWYQSMEEYSRRRLTYETDKLPAVSALAKLLSQDNPGQEYRSVQDVLEPCPQGYKLKQASQEYIAPSWSWARCPDLVKWFAPITYPERTDRFYFSEYTLLNAEIVVADKSNPYGRLSSACLELDAKLLRVPLQADGKAKVVRNTRSWAETWSLDLDYVFLSPSDEYIAHFQLDWDSMFGYSGYPNGPIEQMWMVLTSSLKYKSLLSQPWELGPGEKCLGLLLLPTGNEREFIKVGVWAYDLENKQGETHWEGIQPQSIRIV